MLPLEIKLTEDWLILAEISVLTKGFFLLFLIFILSLVNWKMIFKKRLVISALFFLILLATPFYIFLGFKTKEISKRGPLLISVKPKKVLHGQKVILRGKRFGPPYKEGKVFVNNQELIIKYWSEKKIVAEQVVPKTFGPTEIYLVTGEKRESNHLPYEIRNPDDVWWRNL